MNKTCANEIDGAWKRFADTVESFFDPTEAVSEMKHRFRFIGADDLGTRTIHDLVSYPAGSDIICSRIHDVDPDEYAPRDGFGDPDLAAYDFADDIVANMQGSAYDYGLEYQHEEDEETGEYKVLFLISYGGPQEELVYSWGSEKDYIDGKSPNGIVFRFLDWFDSADKELHDADFKLAEDWLRFVGVLM